jgi:hypothetical protein
MFTSTPSNGLALAAQRIQPLRGTQRQLQPHNDNDPGDRDQNQPSQQTQSDSLLPSAHASSTSESQEETEAGTPAAGLIPDAAAKLESILFLVRSTLCLHSYQC